MALNFKRHLLTAIIAELFFSVNQMDVKKTNPSWQSFMSAKLEGGVRNANMSSFIQKSNVFQNEVQPNTEAQRTTLSQLEIILGKPQEPEDPIKNQVEFRSEPLRPKQTHQERDMWIVAKPLIQEYTTLNIVKQPVIQPNTHRISAELHTNLDAMIKKSESLTMEKKNSTIIPKKGESNQQKVINERFLEHIRRTDQSVSPLRQKFASANPYVPSESQKDQQKPIMDSRKDMLQDTQLQKKSKYDKEFNFQQYAQARGQQRDKHQLIDITLPTNIQDIMTMKQNLQKIDPSLTQYQFSMLPEDEYLFMEDLVEKSNFDQKLPAQSVEQQHQVKKEQETSFNAHREFAYDKPQSIRQADDVDINSLDFNSIIQIASGTINPDKLKSIQNHQKPSNHSSAIGFHSQQPVQSQNVVEQAGKVSREASKTEVIVRKNTTVIDEDEEEYEQDEDDQLVDKCIGTTTRPDQVSQKDQSIQISSLQIDEDIRNIPRVGIILNQIRTIKSQYLIAAERQDKLKLKYLLNHRLVDLMNLIMINEDSTAKTIGEAVQYLLSLKKDKLSTQNIDGVSKLELFYIFLTEYKHYKVITENEVHDDFKVVKEEERLFLVPRRIQKNKQNKGNQMQHNKKDFNSLSIHFRSSPRQSENENQGMPPRYMQNTQSTLKKYGTNLSKKQSSPKSTPQKPKSKAPKVKPFEEEANWITRQNFELEDIRNNFGWTKVV